MFVEVYVDGASRGQGTVPGVTGEAACAATVYRNKKKIGQFARGLGRRTNNEAEYEAILLGLLICWAADLKDPIIYSDSSLCVNQILGVWACNAEDLVPLLISIQEIQEEFRFRIVHVPRAEVGDADELVNEFLDNMLARESSRPRRKKKSEPHDNNLTH